MKYLFLIIFVSFSISLYPQIQENKICVLLDIDCIETVIMYKSLNEDSALKLQHNFEEEDYITFNIISKNDSMFYVEANYEINGFIGRGWIKRSVPIKIFARNYMQSLNLYSNPAKESSVQCEIKEYIPEQYDVLDYDGLWLKIRIIHN